MAHALRLGRDESQRPCSMDNPARSSCPSTVSKSNAKVSPHVAPNLCPQIGRREAKSEQIETAIGVPAKLHPLHRFHAHDDDRFRVFSSKHHVRRRPRFFLDPRRRRPGHVSNPPRKIHRVARNASFGQLIRRVEINLSGSCR